MINMLIKSSLLFFGILIISTSVAQRHSVTIDTIPTHTLDSIEISSWLRKSVKQSLPDVSGMSIFAGKHTDALQLDASAGNLPQGLARTLFAQIPGLNFWEMDGAGTQVNMGTRGTDAHRSIEMNMRQNGYNTNSDLFGYPENHYSVPMQGIEQVQLVRGSAALQFGSQFGGMMNYVMKRGDSTKPFSFETEQTVGSDNLFNSFNAVGGTTDKLSYYGYYNNRSGTGWRANAAFKYHAYYANVDFRLKGRGSLAFQFSRMDYVQQIAGGLTDAQFNEDPRQSERSRNYFQPIINIPAIVFIYSLSPYTKINITSNAVIGERNSVQFINPPNISDTFNAAIGSFNPRQVDRDHYNGMATEARLLHSYVMGTGRSTLAAGIRYSNQITKRRQKGTGTTGSDFDLSLVKPYGIDLRFHTVNYAVFAENIFQIGDKFSVTPGFRYEVINSGLSGVINNATDNVSYKGNRSFPLFGVGLQYSTSGATQLYGNVSQAYRPYLYSNITPADRLDVIDPGLKDTKGYSIDAGYRGNFSNLLRFDINAYYVHYADKIGLVSMKNSDNTSYLLTTNIGDAVAKGIEAYIEFSITQSINRRATTNDVSIFNSFAIDHARYTNGELNKGGSNVDITGKRIENSPEIINKTGLSIKVKTLTARVLFSYSGFQYNDAFNTESSNNGVIGKIPAYSLWDFSFNWQFKPAYRLSGGINNVANEKYFNRRITMYPGPGILPGDGRTFYLSLGAKI